MYMYVCVNTYIYIYTILLDMILYIYIYKSYSMGCSMDLLDILWDMHETRILLWKLEG